MTGSAMATVALGAAAALATAGAAAAEASLGSTAAECPGGAQGWVAMMWRKVQVGLPWHFPPGAMEGRRHG